jgi:RNA recognition motif-containing protein
VTSGWIHGFLIFVTCRSFIIIIMFLQLIFFSLSSFSIRYVSKFIKKSERMAAQDELNFTNLYVKNLGEDMTEELLRDQFSKFGKVSNVTIMKDSEGKSRGFGFVNFDSSEEAKNAAGALNGAFIGKHPTSSFLFPLVLSIIMQRKFH